MNVVFLSALGLSPYRTVEIVEPSLDVSVFQACADLSDGLYSVRFSIQKDGKASLLEGEDCFSAVENITFTTSPTIQDVFNWDVIYQGGVLFPQLLRKESRDIIFPGIYAQNKEKLIQSDESKNGQ